MRVLLDECLPRRLRGELHGHDVTSVPDVGWSGKSNGELLQLAAGRFDVFVTIDQGLQYQQNLHQAELSVVVLRAKDNRLQTLRPLIPQLLRALGSTKHGEVNRIGD